ncbi:MAG TPA: alpha/beta hydrolase [Polyangiaceae bacterium]|jgi:pimeloyl-ACP methyl ester carboxylesterase|nr:alpha/beta hydrolase [Polyangiaceae bacterium]
MSRKKRHWLDTSPHFGAFWHADRAWATSTRAGISFIETELATVRVRVEGQGAITVLFAADPPNVVEHYDALFAEVAPWARVACFELPGFGFSAPRPGFGFDMAANSRVVREVLTSLGGGPFVLAFPCLSGFVALRVAAEEPERVSAVALSQTPSWADMVRWSRRVDPRGVLAMPVAGQAFVRLRRRAVADAWYRVAAGQDSTASALALTARAAFDHGAAYCLASAFQANFSGASPDLGPRTGGLVAWGMRDRTHRKSDPDGALEYLDGASVIRLHVGHFPELEAPSAFAAALKVMALSKGPGPES